METRKVEVAIIGAGTAGMGAYREAVKRTDRVLLIEGKHYGTTCARVGCMPSKLLIAAAEAAHQVTHAGIFGVRASLDAIDGQAVMARVRNERDRFVGFVEASVDGFPEAHKLMGQARFKNAQTLLIDDHTQLEAERIVIATGSQASYPKMLAAAGDRLVINDDLFNWNDLPRSVAVFGPGVIGLELGQALARLGVRVRVFGVSGSLGPLQDPEIRDYALRTFNDEFYLDTEAKVHSVQRRHQAVDIEFDDPQGNRQRESFDYLLAATGRRPCVEGLGLENTGLDLDEQGIPLSDRFTAQCQVQGKPAPIFIAGDVRNDIPLLHEAADEGRIAGANAGSFPQVKAGLRRTPLAVVFSDPQIAQVGMSLSQIKQQCNQCYATGQVNFEGQGRSRVIAKNKGLLKLYGQQGSGLLLGAEMFGPAAEHIAHLLSWCIQQRMTVSQILDMPFYHPVIEEGVRTALRDLNAQLKIGPEVVERCLDCGPGA